ncbi:MAG TPA: hypothetical protein VGP72_06865, partial [Planctomycetota bacterium]
MNNPASTSWLLGFYATVALIFQAFRLQKSELNSAYRIYLVMLNQYLLIVWVLHTWRPGVDPQRTHRQILWFEQAL